jgi:IclR family KDG regulon transcriptional repressor
MLSTINKAGAVLDLFTTQQPEWGVTEVAGALGTSKASAHAVLSTLVDIGLMRRTPDNRYRLGWRLLALSRVLVESVDFRAYARRRMQHLARRYGGTLHLAVLDGAQVLYLEKAEGPASGSIAATGVGLRMDAHCSAVGKVLLAAGGIGNAHGALEQAGMARHTPRTITSSDELDRELVAVRSRGYARDEEEGLDGVCCFAAPIYDRHHVVQAAISVSVSPAAFRRAGNGYRRIVQTTASDVSRDLASLAATN